MNTVQIGKTTYSIINKQQEVITNSFETYTQTAYQIKAILKSGNLSSELKTLILTDGTNADSFLWSGRVGLPKRVSPKFSD